MPHCREAASSLCRIVPHWVPPRPASTSHVIPALETLPTRDHSHHNTSGGTVVCHCPVGTALLNPHCHAVPRHEEAASHSQLLTIG